MERPEDSLLYIAYPLLPVSDSSAGGAEQMLWTLEREVARRDWHTAVAACDGSKVSGELIATGSAPVESDRFEAREQEHTVRVLEACATRSFSLIHDHSADFLKHAAKVDAPVLATLHLPRHMYAEGMFDSVAENLYFNCVSESQSVEFSDLPRMVGVVRNGLALDRFSPREDKEDFVLWLGRICPEKAPHLAIEAAQRAGVRIVLAGQVYPFRWHEQYFEREVKPRIDGDRVRYVELPSFEQKLRLLQGARALLVTSLVAETTSLVALEAMACGTPVIAFPNGALTEVVRDGETGFLVPDVERMALALPNVGSIRADVCRSWVEDRYSADAMCNGYLAVYQNILSHPSPARYRPAASSTSAESLL